MTGMFLGIDHIGIATNDFDTAITTYRDILGFEISGEETLPDRGIRVAFVNTGGVPEHSGRIELLAAIRPDSEISNFLSKRGEGMHHICVRVRDIHAAVKALRAKGATIIGTGPKPGAHNTLVVFVHPKSSHGVLLELVQATNEQAPSPM